MATFSAQYRLRSPRDFQRVYECRCSASNTLLLLYGCMNDLGRTRLGLSVSRRFGNAIMRNRFKRLAREAFRTCRNQLPQSMDYVLLPRGAPVADLKSMSEALVTLAQLVGLRAARVEKKEC